MTCDKIIFQRNVKFIRGSLSQARFGEEIGVSQHTVSKYEKDDANPTLDNLIAIAEAGNITIEALLTTDLADRAFNFGSRKSKAGEYEYSHFVGMTYHVYYLAESTDEQFHHGFISFAEKYDGTHLFLLGNASTGHTYDCKMVIEGNQTCFIYGIEMDMDRRFHIGLYYPDFREEYKYHAGMGLLTRIDKNEFFTGAKVAFSDVELDLGNPAVADKLKGFLSETGCDKNRIVVNREMDEDFRNWVANI